MTNFQHSGYAVPGTYAISTVCVGGSKSDGSPVVFVTSAVCDMCDMWASELWSAGESFEAEVRSLTDARIRRQTLVIVYSCPEHSAQIATALVDEYGAADQRYSPNDLAIRVARQR